MQNFPALTYTFFSRKKDVHDNGVDCGRLEPGMRNYYELYTAIKNNRKKSAATFKQELLIMFLFQ